MSAFFDIDCGGETVTIEKTDNGDCIFHGWDEETERAAIELGFVPSACWIAWDAINNAYIDYALICQSRAGDTAAIKLLLFVEANVDAKGEMGRTPLHYAVLYDRADVAEILLSAGASVDAPNVVKQTPLYHAAAMGYMSVVKVLLKAGANIDAKDSIGWTPLHKAALRGHATVAKILLEAGANINKDNIARLTPLDYAKYNRHDNVVAILKDWIREHGK